MKQTRQHVTARIALIYFVLCGGMATAQTQTAHRVRIVLSAHEAAVRTSVANLDIYSVRIQPNKGPAIEGIALDRYPNYQESMPRTFVGYDQPISVQMRRTPYCDRISVKSPGGEAGALPCFTVVHGSWIVPKNQAKDEWWK